MRSVKKLLKKAMVFTLTAAMLVGTPLTASAAPLNSVYSIRDHWGEDKDNVDDASHTGTVTNTETTTETGALKDNEAKIIGIVLDKSHVNVEVGGARENLTATIVTDLGEGEALVNKDGEDATEEMMSVLKSKLKWQVLNPDGSIDGTTNRKLSIDTVTKGDGSQIVLNPRQGTKAGEDMIVKVSLDGTYCFEKDEESGEWKLAELVTNKTEGYSAEATVSIKEYSEALRFEGVTTEQFVKHTYNLGVCLVRTPETANDTITWTSSDTKTATVNADGIVTFKKVTQDEDTVKITAVSEKGKKADVDFTVSAGTPASKVEIWPEADGDDVKAYKNGTKLTLDLGADTESLAVRVKMYAKVKGVIKSKANAKMAASSEEDFKTKSNGKYDTGTLDVMDGSTYYTVNSDGEPVSDTLDVTDNITWSTSKATIATVTGDNVDATIEAAGKALGTAKITAKASSGKSANVNAVVKASLNNLRIEGAPSSLYSGQSVQLTAGRDPELNKDAVKWSIAKVWYEDSQGREKSKANPNASISSKGVLTIKSKLDPQYSYVTVLLQTKATTKNEDGQKVPVLTAEEVTIDIAQSSMDGFTITDDAGTPIATFKTEYKSDGKVKSSKQTLKNQTTNISVPKGRTYTATVQAAEGQEYVGGAETLVWKSKSDKIAKVVANGDGTARITAVAAGTTTITVSGVRVENKADGSIKSAKTISATFKVAVKQPTTSITIKTPSVVVKEANKDTSVTFKATQNKGAKETITWSVQKNGASADETIAKIKGSKVTLKKGKYQAGDVFTVTAASQSGVTATATIQVITASKGVRLVDEETGEPFKYLQKRGKSGSKVVNNATTLELGKSIKLVPQVDVGMKDADNNKVWLDANELTDGKQAAAVTYSVSKKGIVQIVGNTVYRVGNGTVKVTVKTADGKKYTLTIDDESKKYVAPPTED